MVWFFVKGGKNFFQGKLTVGITPDWYPPTGSMDAMPFTSSATTPAYSDASGVWNSSTYLFTAPITGNVSVTVSVDKRISTGYWSVAIYRDPGAFDGGTVIASTNDTGVVVGTNASYSVTSGLTYGLKMNTPNTPNTYVDGDNADTYLTITW